MVYQHGYYGYQSDIWVMKEYGVVSSWLKSATVEYPRSVEPLKVLGFRNNDEALISFPNKFLASHNPNTTCNGNLMYLPGLYSLHSFVESLVLLDKETYEGLQVVQVDSIYA